MKYFVSILFVLTSAAAFAADKMDTYIYAHGLLVKTVPAKIIDKDYVLVKKSDMYSVLVNETYHLEFTLNKGIKLKDYKISNCTSGTNKDSCLIKISEGSAKNFKEIQTFREGWVNLERSKSKHLLEQSKVSAKKSIPSFHAGWSYQADLWGANKKTNCVLKKETKEKRVYDCQLVKNHTGYEISIEKNSEKGHITYLNKKTVWYKPTKELLPYVDNGRWKKIGLTKEQYGSLHMFQNQPYKCVVQLNSHNNMQNGSTYCVTTLQNNPNLGQVSIQYITQLTPTSEIVHIKAYTLNKYKAAPLFKGARQALESLRFKAISPEVNRLPASR